MTPQDRMLLGLQAVAIVMEIATLVRAVMTLHALRAVRRDGTALQRLADDTARQAPSQEDA